MPGSVHVDLLCQTQPAPRLRCFAWLFPVSPFFLFLSGLSFRRALGILFTCLGRFRISVETVAMQLTTPSALRRILQKAPLRGAGSRIHPHTAHLRGRCYSVPRNRFRRCEGKPLLDFGERTECISSPLFFLSDDPLIFIMLTFFGEPVAPRGRGSPVSMFHLQKHLRSRTMTALI